MSQQKRMGQTLVELALVVPFFITLMFAVIEIGHYWQTMETVKMAAMDGAYAAANFHDASIGTSQLQTRLTSANIPYGAGTQVTASTDESTYTATVNATFTPFFGGMSLPSLAGPLTIIPAAVPVTYQAIRAVAVY